MKSLFFALIVVPGIHSVKNLQGLPNLGDGQVILCSDVENSRYLKIEVLDSQRQTAHLTYSTGAAAVVDSDAAYARSGAGFDFAVVAAGRPTFTVLLEPDQRNAHVPRNGALISCGEAF